jgi:hypothetical protein
MNTPIEFASHNPTEISRLHDAARARAEALRREAIDDFWRGANAVLSTAFTDANRAAARLAARLRQHAKLRASAGRAGVARAVES